MARPGKTVKLLPDPSTLNSPAQLQRYYWVEGENKHILQLYAGTHKEAVLDLTSREGCVATLVAAKETISFIDRSTFFEPKLLLLEKNSGQSLGKVRKDDLKPGEGIIRLQGNPFGWKFRYRPDPCLMMLDQKRQKLFSYHYGSGFVRLLMNKSGLTCGQIHILLAIGLILLPIWQPQLNQETED